MKRVDLGFGIVALEPSDATDRVDSVPDDVFQRHDVSPAVAQLYQEYQFHVIEAEAERERSPTPTDAASDG